MKLLDMLKYKVSYKKGNAMSESLISKVLILDTDQAHFGSIKQFCDENNLIGLKVDAAKLFDVLRSNIDLGAILYSDTYGGRENTEIALAINAIRPELPIIIRRTNGSATRSDLPESVQRCFSAAYLIEDTSPLKEFLQQYVFSLEYPNALVRGISEITKSALMSQFHMPEITMDAPYIVRDRVIYGDLFSLIPIESTWCRGYMMIQASEESITKSIGQNPNTNFREVNSILGEVTNLIWGSFKNKYIDTSIHQAAGQIQVPLVVNHKQKYISFGTENPQLCFCYTMTDINTEKSVIVYQRFIFNLNWSPEDFKEIIPEVESLVESGEMELF